MLRITRADTNGAVESLRVEGRLTRGEIARLQHLCAELLEGGARLALDLAGLQFADREGVAALRTLRRRGVALLGASGFVEALLADPHL